MIRPEVYEQALLTECIKNAFSLKTKATIMSQGDHETMGFKALEESFKYSADRMMHIFDRYVTSVTMANNLVAQGPEAIANYVYALRMGNGDRKSGDGWKYRGRGIIQLTGRANYATQSFALNLPLLTNPELALVPENAARIAISYFKARSWLMKAAAAGDVLACSCWINLGHYNPASDQKPNGLENREARYKWWLQKLSR